MPAALSLVLTEPERAGGAEVAHRSLEEQCWPPRSSLLIKMLPDWHGQ